MKKTIITLAAVIFSILAVAFTVFTQRTQTDPQEITVTPNAIIQQQQESSQEQSTDPPVEQEETKEEVPEEEAPLLQEKKSAFHITNQDCYNECENFTPNSSGWRYCASRCDIIPVQDNEGECDTKTGLSKDYCLRDSAIKNNTPEICDTISDRGLAQQCTNKIIESLVDGF